MITKGQNETNSDLETAIETFEQLNLKPDLLKGIYSNIRNSPFL